MYIQTLELTNFQSHSHTKIDFDKGLNTIFGESDQGKTSIIRALRFVFYNRPAGADFIRNEENFTDITVTLDNGNKISRIKNRKGLNRYILFKDNKKTVYDNFGTDVPAEIKEALGIDKANFDKNTSIELNLAQQLDPPFLLSETGSTGAKFIGKLSGIDLADTAIQDLNKDIRNIGIEKRNSESKIKELIYRLEAYKDLPSIKEKIEKIEILLKDIKKTSEKLTQLHVLNQRTIHYREEKVGNQRLLEKYKNIPDFAPIENIQKKLESYIILSKKYTSCILLQEKCKISLHKLDDIPEFSPIENLQTKLEKHIRFLNLYKINKEKSRKVSIVLESYSDLPDIAPIIETYEKISAMAMTQSKAQKLNKRKEELLSSINHIDFVFTNTVKEYKVILEEAKICPTCGSNLSDNRIKNIIGGMTKGE